VTQHAAPAFSYDILGLEHPHQHVDLGGNPDLVDVVLLLQLRFDLDPTLPVREELPEAGPRWTEGEDSVRLQVNEHDFVAQPARHDVGGGRRKRGRLVPIHRI